jgi:hypothetical protein
VYEICVHVGIELTQGLVEVIHLCQDADDCDENEDVCAWVSELVVAAQGQLDGDTDTFYCHDGDGANSAADGNVNQRVLASITRAHAVDHDGREDNDQQHIEEEAYFTSVAWFGASSSPSHNSPG